MPKKTKGFTLLELMIVVVIVGILAAIAFPTYQGVVRKTRRADAQKDLLGLANALERYHTQNDTYEDAADADDKPIASLYPAYSPSDGGAGGAFYTLTATALSDTGYTLTATPVAGKTQEDDGALQYDNRGRKFWDKDNDGSFAESEIWE
jgi:type IV pilus assembly protein PilE